jgi:hypothetical protein
MPPSVQRGPTPMDGEFFGFGMVCIAEKSKDLQDIG